MPAVTTIPTEVERLTPAPVETTVLHKLPGLTHPPVEITVQNESKVPTRASIPGTQPVITFRQTGPNSPNKLLDLPRVERCSDGKWGVHYGTALTACQIIAMNTFHGHLFTSATPSEETRVRGSLDQVLFENEYYFIVPGIEQYHVVPAFEEWRFPDNIPEHWTNAHAAMQENEVNDRDRSCCVITGASITDGARLCPAIENEWFKDNEMERFGVEGINTLSNVVSLDCCLHRTLDQRIWVFAPRRGRMAVQMVKMAPTHGQLCEFVAGYHGLPVRMAQGRAEFFFTRFAWAVIRLFKTFLVQRTWSDTLLTRNKLLENGSRKIIEEAMSPKDISARYGGSRVGSPSKRARSQKSVAEEEAIESLESSESEFMEEERGRKRTRREEVVDLVKSWRTMQSSGWAQSPRIWEFTCNGT